MDITEARKVLWIKPNARPLGELIDEGYLTRNKLTWAAEHAYSARLQEAAKVLLNTMSQTGGGISQQNSSRVGGTLPVELSITLEKASNTPWPFPPFKGQLMGALLETGQITLKELGYAIEKAYDQNVRQAAVALSLSRMNQVVKEPVHTGPVEVISGGRSYSARKETQFILIQGAIIGFALGIALTFAIIYFPGIYHPSTSGKTFAELVSSPLGVVSLVIVLMLIALAWWLPPFILDRIINRFDREIEKHRLGQEGEDRTVEMVLQALDGTWTVFRNLIIPGSTGDFDLVLVGPPGVWVLEVKNFRGTYRNIGERWELKQGQAWKSASVNPSRQARHNAARLGDFLRADHIEQFVKPVVVWANQESFLFVENPSVMVWRYNHIFDELGNIWQNDKLSSEERKKIVEKLTKLCEAQKKQAKDR